jgi:hypothetical protein
MINDNLYWYKKRTVPSWYTHGDPRTYTKEEIEDYEKSPSADASFAKIASAEGLTEADKNFLDLLRLIREEEIFNESLEGYRDHDQS